MSFTKENTNIIKGIAILMMLWHHCFLADRFEMYNITFFLLNASQAAYIASFFKICVSLFAFVSGYGLFISYNKEHSCISNSKWIIKRYIKSFSSYWFIVILAWIVCMIIDRYPVEVYKFEVSYLYGLFNMILEFLGLTNFFGGSQLNGTWWYMSAAVSFIVLTPILYNMLMKYGELITVVILFIIPRVAKEYPGGINFMSFIIAFVMGMIFSKNNLFDRYNKYWKENKKIFKSFKFLLMLSMLYFIFKLYCKLPTDVYWDIKWGLIPVFVILFINDYIAKIPLLNNILVFIGTHATNIFLTHTFIRYYYLQEFTYGLKYPIIIVSFLLIASIGISFVIEHIKKILKYNKLINIIINNI